MSSAISFDTLIEMIRAIDRYMDREEYTFDDFDNIEFISDLNEEYEPEDINEMSDIDFSSLIFDLLSELLSPICRYLWLFYPFKTREYFQAYDDMYLVSAVLEELSDMINDSGDIELKFLAVDLIPEYEFSFIRDYKKIIDQVVQDDTFTEKLEEGKDIAALSEEILVTCSDFATLPFDELKNSYNLGDEKTLRWYLAMLDAFSSIFEDEEQFINLLVNLEDFVDDEDDELQDFIRMMTERIKTEKEMFSFMSQFLEMDDDFDDLNELTIDEEYIKENPSSTAAQFVVIASGIDNAFHVLLMASDISDQYTDPIPITAYDCPWADFPEFSGIPDEHWPQKVEQYSEEQISSLTKPAVETILQFVDQELMRLNIQNVSFITPNRIMVDFDEHGIENQSKMSKAWRKNYGEVLISTLNEILAEKYETEFLRVEISMDEYLQENTLDSYKDELI